MCSVDVIGFISSLAHIYGFKFKAFFFDKLACDSMPKFAAACISVPYRGFFHKMIYGLITDPIYDRIKFF